MLIPCFSGRAFRWDGWLKTTVGISLLMLSAATLLLAPSQMPASYSWLRHTTSESAAQGISGAWLARLGFLIFGLTVIWLSYRLRNKWPTSVRFMHMVFGVLMASTAAFSTRPWLPGSVYDPVEDALHSFAATALGFAFTIGVGLKLIRRGDNQAGRMLDLVAVAAAIAIPLAMSALSEWDGLLQRGMFVVAYLWYSIELLRETGQL